MIETIYSKDNSEEMNKPEVNIRLPKNIKQIGQGSGNMNSQIYIEENVLFYIKQKPIESNDLRYGVLLGEKKQANGYTYIFIHGVIDAEKIIDNSIIFSDDVWTGIYDNLKRYYKKSDIVGWYVSSENDLSRDMHTIKKIHLDHFAGNGKVYLNINREEDEEAFYLYERNGLRKQPCYHVYFEKRAELEDYIFGTGFVAAEEEQKVEYSEGGKYGIALNNLRNKSSNSGTESLSKTSSKALPVAKFNRVASFGTILALAGVIYYMGSNGQLDNLSNKMKGVVGNIVGTEKDSDDQAVISVNGNLPATIASTEQKEPEATTVNVAVKEPTTKEIETKEATSTETVTTKSVVEQTTKDIKEEPTTEASISVPNENYEVYIVKAGDTLYSIALNQCGSVNMIEEIININKLDDADYVMEGQKLLIP